MPFPAGPRSAPRLTAGSSPSSPPIAASRHNCPAPRCCSRRPFEPRIRSSGEVMGMASHGVPGVRHFSSGDQALRHALVTEHSRRGRLRIRRRRSHTRCARSERR
jgi:hypothetical protein